MNKLRGATKTYVIVVLLSICLGMSLTSASNTHAALLNTRRLLQDVEDNADPVSADVESTNDALTLKTSDDANGEVEDDDVMPECEGKEDGDDPNCQDDDTSSEESGDEVEDDDAKEECEGKEDGGDPNCQDDDTSSEENGDEIEDDDATPECKDKDDGTDPNCQDDDTSGEEADGDNVEDADAKVSEDDD